jgi:hypothetical protein
VKVRASYPVFVIIRANSLTADRGGAFHVNGDFDEPRQTIFSTLQHGGPLYLLVVLILVCLAFRHLWLSVRSIIRPKVGVPAIVRIIHLLALPSIIGFYLLARLSTSFPGLFIKGIDADMPLKDGLEEARFLGTLGLILFLLSALPALFVLQRSTGHDDVHDP